MDVEALIERIEDLEEFCQDLQDYADFLGGSPQGYYEWQMTREFICPDCQHEMEEQFAKELEEL